MEAPDRPDGITLIAVTDLVLGVVVILVSIFTLGFAPIGVFLIILGLFFLGVGYGTWVGMPWAWYVLTMGGGLYA